MSAHTEAAAASEAADKVANQLEETLSYVQLGRNNLPTGPEFAALRGLLDATVTIVEQALAVAAVAARKADDQARQAWAIENHYPTD